MEYIRADIAMPDENEPDLVVSEMDQDRYEVRRVARFIDGRLERASNETETKHTQLSTPSIPNIEDLQKNASGWNVKAISKNEFEEFWKRAASDE